MAEYLLYFNQQWVGDHTKSGSVGADRSPWRSWPR